MFACLHGGSCTIKVICIKTKQELVHILKTLSKVVLMTNHFTNALHDFVDDFSAHCVVAAGVVVGCVLLARDQLLRVEEPSVLSNPHFIYNKRSKVSEIICNQTRFKHTQVKSNLVNFCFSYSRKNNN